MKFAKNFLDQINNSECHSVLEEALDNRIDLRVISPENAIFIENENDPFCLTSPIVGERRKMFKHDIIQKFELDTAQIKELDSHFNQPDVKFSQHYEEFGNEALAYVYTLQWVAVYPEYTKVEKVKGSDVPYRTSITSEKYEKRRGYFENQEKKGKIKIEKRYREEIWTGHRIGVTMFIGIEKLRDQIQATRGGQYLNAYYDYINFLFDTYSGIRTSYLDMMKVHDFTYDLVRHMINRELTKIKGNILTFDKAFLDRDIQNVFHEMSEEGVMSYNSSEEHNLDRRDLEGKVGVGSVTIGDPQILKSLIEVGISVEDSMDRLIGFNKPRQGRSPATSTATATNSDRAASMIATYNAFWHNNIYIAEVLDRMLQKVKINYMKGVGEAEEITFNEEEERFIKTTANFTNDELAVAITDGKKEQEQKARIREIISADVNAGKLRSADVVEFELSESLALSVKILRNAWATINKEETARIRQAEEAQAKTVQMIEKGKVEDREDRQAHEKDLVILKAKVKEQEDKFNAINDSIGKAQDALNERINTGELETA
jgi:hypothetical protein